MKKNFIKILACTLAMSTMCSVTTASAYTNGLTDDLRENMSEELKNFILTSDNDKVITENCVVKSIYYIGLDENGKETYDYAQLNEQGDYEVPAIAALLGFDENGKEIIGGAYNHLVFFDEQGNPKILQNIYIGKTENNNLIYKTGDVVTGEDIIVITAEGDSATFGNVVARCGDTNCDGTVDVRDVTTINQHIIKANILPDYADTVADVNDDGNIDISDLGLLKQYIIKMIDSF